MFCLPKLLTPGPSPTWSAGWYYSLQAHTTGLTPVAGTRAARQWMSSFSWSSKQPTLTKAGRQLLNIWSWKITLFSIQSLCVKYMCWPQCLGRNLGDTTFPHFTSKVLGLQWGVGQFIFRSTQPTVVSNVWKAGVRGQEWKSLSRHGCCSFSNVIWCLTDV